MLGDLVSYIDPLEIPTASGQVKNVDRLIIFYSGNHPDNRGRLLSDIFKKR